MARLILTWSFSREIKINVDNVISLSRKLIQFVQKSSKIIHRYFNKERKVAVQREDGNFSLQWLFPFVPDTENKPKSLLS